MPAVLAYADYSKPFYTSAIITLRFCVFFLFALIHSIPPTTNTYTSSLIHVIDLPHIHTESAPTK